MLRGSFEIALILPATIINNSSIILGEKREISATLKDLKDGKMVVSITYPFN